MRVLLLGVGMQGKAALHDLVECGTFESIVAADRDIAALTALVEERGYGRSVRCEPLDASDGAEVARLMRDADVAIDLLPISFIDTVAQAAVEHRVHLVNTFYVTPAMRALAEEAVARGVTLLPEFGMDPGIDLVMLGDALRSFDTVTEIASYGAGIPAPEAADNPLRYKVSWTFEGVLETYCRVGRVIEEGRIVEIPRNDMFDARNVHHLEIEGLGTLEAFPNGDAVSYVEQLGLPQASLERVGRYTMRWPGHAAFWKTLVDLQLLDDDPVLVDGVPVHRRKYLAAALGPQLQYGPEEQDLAIIRLEVRGVRAGARTEVMYQVVDRRDRDSGLSAMSRLVGYTASIGAQLMACGTLTKPGLLSPLSDVPYAALASELGRRGVGIAVAERVY